MKPYNYTDIQAKLKTDPDYFKRQIFKRYKPNRQKGSK